MLSMGLDEITGYFTGSLSQVLSTMAGFEINSISCNPGDSASIEYSIIGAMVLHGKKDTMISLSMERSTASMIIAYMTGILPEELNEHDLYDGVAELVNIMAGEVKARLSNTPHHFVLTSPFSIGGENLKVIYKQNIPGVCRRLMAGEMELVFKIAYI